jgi:hypothetical protein
MEAKQIYIFLHILPAAGPPADKFTGEQWLFLFLFDAFCF